jgi:hypothetical protein
MPLRIAFDLDGTVADMDGALGREVVKLLGESRALPRVAPAAENPAPDDLTDASRAAAPDDESSVTERMHLTTREQQRLWRHVNEIENFWEGLEEIEPGIVARLWTVSRERRWEVIFLTQRPETRGATPQLQSQRWLARCGFELPSVYVVDGSRGRVAASLSLDVVVDDRPVNCLDVATESKARSILVWRAPEQHLPASARRVGIGVVKSVAECLDILTQIDAITRPTMIDKLKRLLGLNSAALA